MGRDSSLGVETTDRRIEHSIFANRSKDALVRQCSFRHWLSFYLYSSPRVGDAGLITKTAEPLDGCHVPGLGICMNIEGILHDRRC